MHGKALSVRVSATSSSGGQLKPREKQVPRRHLGKSGVEVSEVGIGAWSWGDRSNYWVGWKKEECQEAFDCALADGLTFIDTAEVYGFGQSEEFLGEFIGRNGSVEPQVATKYAPLPWRQSSSSVVSALDASCARLKMDSVDLYIQHWPGFLLNAFSNRATLEGLQQCLDQGKTRAVGVSNFNEKRTRDAAKFFEGRGSCLSSNQVQYSLLYREPERNGVLEACRDHGVSLVAYSPICQGMLSGKYNRENLPNGPRKMYFTDKRFSEVDVLLSLMQEMSKENGKTMTQIAVNWLLCKDVIPIVGVRNTRQVSEVAGASGWRLSDAEVSELDARSANIPSSTGAPFEKW
jgi:aryl-alcohol dehydrogenase-like predicted oxidoreductase